MNSLLHYGSPKFLATPDDPGLIGTIWVIFSSGATSDEIEAYFAHAPSVTSSCIRVLLPDQTYGRLRRLRGDLDAFVRERVAADRRLSQVHLSYLGGDAGVVMATDEVLGRLGVVNLALAITMIVACCAIMFRSLRAGLLLALSSVAASFISSIYMHYGNIALTTYIVPILSLGLGLGVNYGIYIAFGIRDNVGNGASLSRAIVQAVCTAGGWSLAGYGVLAGGMLPWIFSPLLFHHQMSVLLILMMTSNLVAGVFMLPALIAWSQPRFLTCRKQDSATLEPASSAAGS
jgi:predicted RND superfamily exporter protein